MDIKKKIDKTIKFIWKEKISNDYFSDHLLQEDSLKNAFYYHLRNELGDGFLKRHRIRVFTEFHLSKQELEEPFRGDIVVVRVKPLKEMEWGYFVNERVEDIVAIIELKYKSCTSNKDFHDDIEKMRKYVKGLKSNKPLLYTGFIHEQDHPVKETSWISTKDQSTWAKGRLCELNANRNEGTSEFEFTVISHNELNEELDSRNALNK
jgi:hypothetical protein